MMTATQTSDALDTIRQAMRGSAEARRQCYAWLVGAEQGWLHACYQVCQQASGTLARLENTEPLGWAWHLIGERCERDEFRYPDIARAIASCAHVAALIRSLEPQAAHQHVAPTLAEHVLQAVYQWQQSHADGRATNGHADAPAACLETHADAQAPLAQQVRGLLHQIQQAHPAWNIAPVRDLIAFFLHGTPPPSAAVQRIPVLLDAGSAGLVADIHLDAVPAGWGACYPDPCAMAFFRGDAAFGAALDTAHTYARAQVEDASNVDVRWRLTVRPTAQHPTAAVRRVDGASLGAGFAVGMLHLLDLQRPDLDPSWAITGHITDSGAILSVRGYPAKIETALEHDLRVIVPAASLDTLREQWQAQPQTRALRGVETVAQASEIYSLRSRAACPYRGLEAFTEHDAAHFFGRQRLIDMLLEALQPAPRLLALLGPSGSGKSSLIRAGLIPHLRRGAVGGSAQWGIVLLRPADHPFAHLARHGLDGTDGTDGAHLSEGVRRWLAAHVEYTHLLLVLDQFEELLVSGSDAIRQQFVTHLVETLAQPDLPVTIVIVMRDDFYSRLNQQAPDMMPWVARALVNVPPTLTPAELARIVQEPANAVGWEFEQGLVEAITQDVRDASRTLRSDEQSARATLLPLLEFALTQLWEQRQDGMLTHDAYQSIGRVTGALTHWATTTFEQLTHAHQALARRIFTDLVYLGDEHQGLPDSRRRRPFLELYRQASEREAVTQVIQHMSNARLLVTARDPQSGEETAELIHETLVHEWARLREWLSEDRLFLAWRQMLESRQSAWATSARPPAEQRDPDLLLRGRELDEAEHWLTRRPHSMTDSERDYIQASLTYRAQQQQHAQQRARWRRLLVVGALAVLSVLAGFAGWQWASAQEQLDISESRRIAFTARSLLERNPELALLLVIEAAHIDQNAEVESMLHQVVQAFPLRSVGDAHGGTVTSVAFGPESLRLVTTSTDRTARLWDAQTGAALQVLEGHTDFVNDAAFSPDGRQIVTASSDRTARLWDVQTGAPIRVLRGHTGSLVQAAFSPDGSRIVTASGLGRRSAVHDQTARVWDARTGEMLHRLLHDDAVSSAAFSPDGRQIVTASSDTTARVWDVQTGAQTLRLDHAGRVTHAQFHPDGRQIVTIGDDEVMRVWDAASGTQTQALPHTSDVHSMAISPDGAWIVTGDSDGMIQRWDTERGQRTRQMRAHARGVEDIAVSPDGALLATASDDQTFRLWATQDAEELRTLRGHRGPVYQAAFSPDGQAIVTASADATARVWDAATGAAVHVLRGHTRAVRSAAFSPDGRRIASASADTTVRLWDAQTGAPIDILRGHAGPVHHVAYAPDGASIASVSSDNTARIWDAQTGAERALLKGHEGDILSIAFTPDSQHVVTVGHDYTMRIWHIETATEVQKVSEHGAIVRDVAVSPDGQMIATGSDDTNAYLWTWDSPHEPYAEQQEHTEAVTSVAFGPDSAALLTASADGSVRRWAIHADAPPVSIWRGETGVHDAQFSPDQRYVILASDDGNAYLCYAAFADILALAEARAPRELTAAERDAYVRQP